MTIPLHRVRFALGSQTHLELEWVKGRGGSVSPVSIAPCILTEIELEPDDASNIVPAMCLRINAPALFQPFQLRENTDYYIDVTLPFSAAEATRRMAGQPGWPFSSRLSNIFKPEPPRRWRQNPDGTTTISGQLRLRSHAGILDLSVGSGQPLLAEVVCRKLSYMDEFKALLDDVAAEMTELLLHNDSPVSASFNLTDLAPETRAALLFQLRHIMAEANLPTTLEEIRRHIHSQLRDVRSVVDVFEAEDFDAAALIDEMDHHSMAAGGPLQGLFRGYTPRYVPVTKITDTTDTPENRYVKSFMEELRQLAQRLASSYAVKSMASALREIEGWIDTLDEELSSGIWKSVGAFKLFPSNSQVLMKRQGYRDILRFDLSLRMSLELPWKRSLEFAEGLMGDIRPVNELYEYWCFFHLRRCLSDICVEQSAAHPSFVASTSEGFQMRLLRGSRSKVGFVYRRDNGRVLHVNLFYNRRFTRPNRSLHDWHGSYTASFDPDYSIEARLEADGEVVRHWLHFDAKYRVAFEDLSQLLPHDPTGTDDESDEASDYDTELARLHRRDDLFKMHTYRDGILSSRGAYILFPGNADHSSLFVRHPSAFGSGTPAYLFPSVGAFSLCPGREATQRAIISDFIAGALRAIFDGKPYQEETGFFE
jgi:uncharacterized protein